MKRISLIIIALALLALCILIIRALAPQSVIEVKVGVDDYPPFTYIDKKTGKYTGFDIDMLKFIAKDQNLKLTFVKTPFSRLISNIATKKLDMSDSITILTEREKKLDFSWPIMEMGLSLAYNSSCKKIKGLDDLKNLTVATYPGTGQDLCEQLLAQKKIKEMKIYNETSDLYQALAENKVQAVINDNIINKYYAKIYPGKIICLSKLYEFEYLGFPVRTGNNELRTRLNNGIQEAISSGEYLILLRKYFHD
jgi:polar amino acid transport system substrate-binding protein